MSIKMNAGQIHHPLAHQLMTVDAAWLVLSLDAVVAIVVAVQAAVVLVVAVQAAVEVAVVDVVVNF